MACVGASLSHDGRVIASACIAGGVWDARRPVENGPPLDQGVVIADAAAGKAGERHGHCGTARDPPTHLEFRREWHFRYSMS